MRACFLLLGLLQTVPTAIVPIASAAGRVIKVTVEGESITGQILAHNKEQCWLVSADGRMHGLDVSDVKRFRSVGSRLAIDNAVRVRGRLQDELGRDYTVLASGRYVVAAPRATAQAHLRTFDEIGRTFVSYFAKRSIPLDQPRFPLVAIVFASQSEFAQYAAKDGIRATTGLAGYYLRTSNRVASFEQGSRTAQVGPVIRTGHLPLPGGPAVFRIDLGRADKPHASVAGGVKDTLVHEATHQMAFNSGLHNRAGSDPKWIIEGLATLFEPDAVRRNVASRSPASRVNDERLSWYKQRLASNWNSNMLTDLVSSDRMFATDALDAYSVAWALTFYLNETRPREYAKFLRILKERDPLAEYTPEERLIDFRSTFGRDMHRFEVSMLRFLDSL